MKPIDALLPGMTVIARITAGERETVAAVLLAALDNIRGQDVLYTAGDPKTGTLSAPRLSSWGSRTAITPSCSAAWKRAAHFIIIRMIDQIRGFA